MMRLRKLSAIAQRSQSEARLDRATGHRGQFFCLLFFARLANL